MDILGELTGKEKDFKLAKYFMTNYGKYDETANPSLCSSKFMDF